MSEQIILCVDDETSVLNALRTTLVRHLPHEIVVETAQSGNEALELIDELEKEGSELNAIIADYLMPGMRGDDFLVQAHARWPRTMKILLTGQCGLEGVKRAINQAQLFRFLEKPWLNDDLVLTVQTAIKTYHLDHQLQRRNAELQRINENLEQMVAARTQELQLRNAELLQKNVELERMSITDRLTGLYNRLYLDRVLEREHATTQRYGQGYSIIMVDIDHFKNINDTYGHQAGDTVLIEFGRILQSKAREADVAGRWGGEEFLVICPRTSLGGAAVAAEKIRVTVSEWAFPNVGARSASFGVAQSGEGDSISALIRRADDALYRAKAGGRNRVVCVE